MNFKNNMGHSPLMIIATSNLNIEDKTNILRVLIEAGADVGYAIDNLPAKNSKIIRDIAEVKADKRGDNIIITVRNLSNAR